MMGYESPTSRTKRDIHILKNRPVEEPLAQQLEEAYQAIKPWKESYQDELQAALQVGPAAYEKLKHPLADVDGSVFFDDASAARLIYNSFTNRVSSALFSTLRSNRTNSPYPAAPLVFRGYDEAIKRSSAPSRATSVSPSRPASAPPDAEQLSRRKSMDPKIVKKVTERISIEKEFYTEESHIPASGDAKVGEGSSQEVTDLILVVHGIGQGVSPSLILSIF